MTDQFIMTHSRELVASRPILTNFLLGIMLKGKVVCVCIDLYNAFIGNTFKLDLCFLSR